MADAATDEGRLASAGHIARDPHGAAFLKSIADDLERMREEPDGPVGNRYDGVSNHWPRDTVPWFWDALEVLTEGCKAKEPTLGYLVAEYLRFADPLEGYDLLQLADRDMYDEDRYPTDCAPKFYLQAAAWGSPHAQLWCAFRMSRGESGYPQDPMSIQSMLDRYRALGCPLRSLELPELDFVCYEMRSLADWSETLDLYEDQAGSEGEEPPNPSWRMLHQRVVDVACFLLSLGRTYQTKWFSYCYVWASDFDRRGAELASLKAEWQTWCEEQGLLA